MNVKIPTLAQIRKTTGSPRYKLARKHHRCPEGWEGPCWGPTDEDYAWADAQIAKRGYGPQPATAIEADAT